MRDSLERLLSGDTRYWLLPGCQLTVGQSIDYNLERSRTIDIHHLSFVDVNHFRFSMGSYFTTQYYYSTGAGAEQAPYCSVSAAMLWLGVKARRVKFQWVTMMSNMRHEN